MYQNGRCVSSTNPQKVEVAGGGPHVIIVEKSEMEELLPPNNGDIIISDRVSQSKKKAKKKSKKKATDKLDQSTALFSNALYCIRNDSHTGRKAIAAIALTPGTIVLAEKPFCVVMRAENMCNSCAESIEIDDIYCSHCRESRNSDIETSLDCINEAATHFRCDPLLLTIVFKILFKMQEGTVDDESVCHDFDEYIQSTCRGFQCQVDHLELQSTEWIESLKCAVGFVINRQELFSGVSQELIVAESVRIASRVNMNSYGIVKHLIDNPEVVGLGSFPIAAMSFNHSCSPNLVNVFAGGKMQYRAICDIAAGDELCVSYIDCTIGTNHRRKLLTETRFFKCTCKRCSRFDDLVAALSIRNSGVSDETLLLRDQQTVDDAMLTALHCSDCGIFICIS